MSLLYPLLPFYFLHPSLSSNFGWSMSSLLIRDGSKKAWIWKSDIPKPIWLWRKYEPRHRHELLVLISRSIY
jgi:hypothetical protein